MISDASHVVTEAATNTVLLSMDAECYNFVREVTLLLSSATGLRVTLTNGF